jgi:hypothetical protein
MILLRDLRTNADDSAGQVTRAQQLAGRTGDHEGLYGSNRIIGAH